MNLREALKSGEQYLKDHGITDAAVDAWILLEHDQDKQDSISCRGQERTG